MTQPVGVDGDGALFTAPGGGGEPVWTVIDNVIVSEDTASIVCSGFGPFAEIEAMIFTLTNTATRNIYFTTEALGTIYGEPRNYLTAPTNPASLRIGLKYIGDDMVKCTLAKQNYYTSTGNGGTNYSETIYPFWKAAYPEIVRKTSFTACTVAVQSDVFVAGEQIIIRGR